ncbi:serine hydrolase, partial [Actinacidiphila glaucinigra]
SMTSMANTSNNGTVNTVLGGTLEAAFCGTTTTKAATLKTTEDETFTEDIAPQIVRH